jgi:hypothetical protein
MVTFVSGLVLGILSGLGAWAYTGDGGLAALLGAVVAVVVWVGVWVLISVDLD